jgi:hypothetical protein
LSNLKVVSAWLIARYHASRDGLNAIAAKIIPMISSRTTNRHLCLRNACWQVRDTDRQEASPIVGPRGGGPRTCDGPVSYRSGEDIRAGIRERTRVPYRSDPQPVPQQHHRAAAEVALQGPRNDAPSARRQIWLSFLWTSMPRWSTAGLLSAALTARVLLWGRICHHVKREASRFTLSEIAPAK